MLLSLLLLVCLEQLTRADAFTETFRYQITGRSVAIGECITLQAVTNFPQNGSEIITWQKETKPMVKDPRITITGKSLKITSAHRDDNAFYRVTVENLFKNVFEITNIWISVHGCGNNQKELPPISITSCKNLCEEKCEDGWTYVPETSSKCVQYFGETRTWSDASEHCQSVGAELVTIKSHKENKFVSDMLQTAAGAWIGLNDRQDEGIYIWNFKNKNKATLFSWGKNEPSNFNRACNIENCITLRRMDGKWNDAVCQSFETYVCQVDSSYNGTDRSEWRCYGYRCYKYFHSQLVWKDALEACKRIHITGQLATVPSKAENGLIQSMIVAEKVWIGLNDIWEAGRYTWNVFEGRSDETSFEYWGEGEPNDMFLEPFAPECLGEDCVQIKQFGGKVTWTDLGCASQLPYICEVIRVRQFSTGAYVGMIIGSLLLLSIILGMIQLAYEKHKRTAVKDIIRAAYEENVALKKTNQQHLSFKEAAQKFLPIKKNKISNADD